MRILLPAACFEDSFVDNVRSALVQMGHEVRTLGEVSHAAYWSLPRYAWRVGMGMIRGDRPTVLERRILRVARDYRPDAVLATTGDWHPETLQALRVLCPGRLIIWWGDAPANNRQWGFLDSSWDAVFIKDKAAVPKIRLAGRNAFYLPEAMNPVWHRPVTSQQNTEIAVAGNYYAFRQAILVRLSEDGIALGLYGSRPPRWSHPTILRTHTGAYITRLEKSRVFGAALGCLNTFQLAEGNSLNCRAFEIAGAGGLQLIEHRPVIEECFELGKEILAFSTYDELLEHIDRARKCPKEMVAIREAAARRALSEHTYAHRLRIILRHLA
jgi:spore maturation protein CgeB